jgi:hypothetical protein
MRANKAVTAALAFAACATAGASWFSKGQPVPDWAVEAAKVKTPEYAKDAEAVVLLEEYVDTVDANGRATERHRKVIRILKPQGRQNVCRVDYDVDNKINYFRAWTIAADEKNTYQAQDADFFEVGDTDIPVMLSTHKTRLAKPPAIDVGAVVVCESEELMEPYIQEKNWFVQDDIPIVNETLEVDLPAGRKHAVSWHRYDEVKPAELAPAACAGKLKTCPP